LAYFLREEVGMKKGERVAIVSPNTPMFLESFYGIAGAGCVPLCINYKLTPNGILPKCGFELIGEICWILEFAKPQVVLVDREFKDLVQGYKCKRIIVDDDVDGTTGEYEDIVRKGREIDTKRGGKGWDDLVIDDIEETDTMVLNCMSGTTSNPKVSNST
jgi:acyl-CoA synthetase (AMP-forming)/AMP-acid ligase II